MPFSLTKMHEIFLAGLRSTPEEIAKVNQEMSKKAAEETERYAGLTDEERMEYDKVTLGMMPRIPR